MNSLFTLEMELISNLRSFAFRITLAALLACQTSIFLALPSSAYAQAKALENSQPIMVDGKESEEIWINTGQGRFRFTAEIADEPQERQQGLMFREKMPPTHGMLFDFETLAPVQMWMRNTPLPLDMIFLDPKGKVVSVAERTTPFSDDIIDSGGAISHVLELNAGIVKLIGMKPGDSIEYKGFEN